ncbi:MAG: DNA internalization-related competence protein ComEC/Rec2 [Bacilli bacterium]|nr:DNA internalization-related competence protein ComEC/Rec2 [Bacilli bacterium]
MILKILLKYKYIFISIIILIFSLIYTSINFKSKYSIKDSLIEGYIHNYKIDGNKLNIEIIGKEKIIGNYYFKNNEEIYNFKKKYKFGDYVKISCELYYPKENGLFNQFSYKEYLRQNKIYLLMKIDTINKTLNNNKIRYSIKNFIVNRIESILLSKKYLYAFMIGEEYYIDSKVKDSYQINGISHLFAVSGSNITFVVMILLKIINKFKYKYLFIFSYVLLYMFLTDFTASIVRSGVFFIVLTLNKIYKWNIRIIDILFITLSLSLIYNPYLIHSVGFQFSFIISMYLIIFQKKILKYKNYIVILIIVSTIAFLSSLPIVLNNFYEFNLLSIFLNLIYVPFVSFILFPLSLICFILPFLDKILFFFTNILEYSSLMFSKIDYFKIIIGKPSFLLIIIYYIVITIIMINPKYLYLLIICLIINKLMYYSFYPSIEFIDVGQGDSILIKLGGNKNVLVDTGGILKYEDSFKRINDFSIGDDVLSPYLKSIGISRLECLIITHGDMDHIGGSEAIMNNFNVNNLFLNGNLNELEKKLIIYNPKYLKDNDVLKINNYIFYILNPSYDTNENDSSIILYFTINNINILLMGDASRIIEEKIIQKYNLDIDILKIGHHGSKTSTSINFIKKTTPYYGIISVGENNRFNHPHKEVLEILNNNNVNVFRTDYYGSIKFIFKDKLLIKTGRKYEG